MRGICLDLNRIGIVEGIIHTGESTEKMNINSSKLSINVNSAENDELKVKLACKDTLKKLPSKLVDLDSVRLRYPILREKSLNSLLVQEL
jgi:hypothetical protein